MPLASTSGVVANVRNAVKPARKATHAWQGCKCSKCGKIRAEGHDWAKDCEKCCHCGVERANSHKGTGCECTACCVKKRDKALFDACQNGQLDVVKDMLAKGADVNATDGFDITALIKAISLVSRPRNT